MRSTLLRHLAMLASIGVGAGCQDESVATEVTAEPTWCYAIQCPSGGAIATAIGGESAVLAHATAEVCRNGLCSTITLGDVPALDDTNPYWETSSPVYSEDATLDAQVTLSVWIQQGEVRLTVFYAPESKASLIDGDSYSLRVTLPSDVVLVDGQITADYMQTRYLGPGCGWCMQADMAL